MAIKIYQTAAGYLWIDTKEIPLSDAVMESKYSMNEYYITIKNGNVIAIENAPLVNITDGNDAGFSTIGGWNSYWSGLLAAVPGGTLSLSTYRIPQIEIDGLTESTFTLPFEVVEDGIFYAVNGKFVYTLSDGIESITNGTGSSEIIFSDALLDGNVVVIFYEPI